MFDKATAQHKQLAELAGNWEGVMRMWFEPGAEAQEASIKATLKSILDGRFLLQEYNGMFKDKPLEGLAIFGYHVDPARMESAWIDTFHMGSGIMFSQGEKNAQALSVLGSFAAGEENWGWRTEIAHDGETLVITAFIITPGGEEMKGVETTLHRI